MAAVLSAVGPVAELLNTWSKWIIEPSGYATMTRDQKLEHLHEALKVAMETGAYPAADAVFAEYRRLSQLP